MVIDGQVRQFHSVRDSENAGVAVIFQELSLIKELTIGENIFLGREPRRFGVIKWEELYSRAQKLLDELNLPLDPRTPVGHLGIGQQQLVEIAKALSQEARILVLDEPTAALADAEVETLFRIIDGLRARGVGMIYISHKLDEVFRVSRAHHRPARRPHRRDAAGGGAERGARHLADGRPRRRATSSPRPITRGARSSSRRGA